jgi:hypothetical protein
MMALHADITSGSVMPGGGSGSEPPGGGDPPETIFPLSTAASFRFRGLGR